MTGMMIAAILAINLLSTILAAYVHMRLKVEVAPLYWFVGVAVGFFLAYLTYAGGTI